MLKNTPLWKITLPGSDQSNYLFGTMHIRDRRAFGWMDLAVKCLSECAVFATEFDFSEMDGEAIQNVLTLPDDSPLQKLLPRGAWKNLVWISEKLLRQDVSIFEKMHPMAVSSTLSQVILMSDMPLSLDEMLAETARDLGKICTGVETFDKQIEIMGKIPMKTHVDGLVWMLKNFGRYRRRMKKMAELFELGDIQKLHEVAHRDAKGLRKILINDRNREMTERFLEISKSQGNLFCAVGAGHLAGGNGMLRKLKKAGCECVGIV